MKHVLFLWLLAVLPWPLCAQTCCTGGVQYLGAFRVPAVDTKDVSVSLGYGINRNHDLFLDDKRLDETISRRTVNTWLLQADYGIAEHFSISLVVPYLWQRERVNFAGSEEISNAGLSDISAWASYSATRSRHQLTVSVGVKVPSGGTGALNPENGIFYPVTLQNGSGSWDVLFSLYDAWTLDQRQTLRWIHLAAAKINTPGNELTAHPGYRFGHMFQVSSLLARQWVLGKFLADVFAGISYQHRMQDRFKGGFDNENTGGHWTQVELGYNHQFSPRWSTTLAGSVPVVRKLYGLQLTTSWQAQLSTRYSL